MSTHLNRLLIDSSYINTLPWEERVELEVYLMHRTGESTPELALHAWLYNARYKTLENKANEQGLKALHDYTVDGLFSYEIEELKRKERERKDELKRKKNDAKIDAYYKRQALQEQLL